MSQIRLSLKTVDMLSRPVNGDGGFQNLMRRIQLGLRGRYLDVERADLDALVRATKGRHVGGFQRQARQIIIDAILQQFRREGFLREKEPPPAPARVLSFRQRGLPLGKEPDGE